MPKQHTLCGIAVPFSRRMPPRRIIFAFGIIAFFAISTLVIVLPSSIPQTPSLSGLTDTAQHLKPKIPKIGVPNIHNPFSPAAHSPPIQINSSSGDASWYNDWKWMNPFSSSITLDENRAVLPPLRKRPPIYTFYDTSVKMDDKLRAAESELLLIWRRAWWAQGFKPVVLGRADAKNNPYYESFQSQDLGKAMEGELIRWLAWGSMGTGILANWLAVPMAPYDDVLLSYLRRGQYPKLTLYQSLGNGLFSGEKAHINNAIKAALANKDLKKMKSFVDAVPDETFYVDTFKSHNGVALYDSIAISNHYKPIDDQIKGSASSAEGLRSLAILINAHLHQTFQNTFSKGIAVLKPLDHFTRLVSGAVDIAILLAECPTTRLLPKLEASCPPNRQKCKTCVASQPLDVHTFPVFRNDSTMYTIGVVPHPYTFTSLIAERSTFDTRYIRRKTTRDPWISAATEELVGPGVSGPFRVVKFKEAVASEYGASRSLWYIAEKVTPSDLEWHFGFTLPATTTSKGVATPPVPDEARKPIKPKIHDESKVPSEKELAREATLLQSSTIAIRSKAKPQVKVKEMVEAWNLADTEAWRFTRAYRARGRVERLKWEKEEKEYTGGAVQGWARWFDRL